MTTADLYYILPLIIVAVFSIAVMLLTALYRKHSAVSGLTLAGFVVAIISLFYLPDTPHNISTVMVVDNYAIFYWGLIFSASAAITLLSYGYFGRQSEQQEEYYVLLLTAALGAAVLAASRHFISFFMGLEILSVSLYTMISYLPERRKSVEAGIKYLVLAAASSAFLLFGMALVYAESGTMDFAALGTHLDTGRVNAPILLLGLAMMVIAVGFKLALVPFHLWTPDVYEGAPAPVTAFVATVSKGGMFALWFRFFVMINGYRFNSLIILFTVIAIASMFAGNLLALMQKNVKRILAYSSIAHLGYLMIAFIAGGRLGVEAGTFYLVAYFVTTLGTFGIVTVLSLSSRDADDLEDYRGLLWRRPMLATAFTAMLMSLAGIPLTVGFIGKFYLAAAGVNSALWLQVVMLVINSAISVYYYLKIVVVMYQSPGSEHGAAAAAAGTKAAEAIETAAIETEAVGSERPAISIGSGLVLAVLTLVLIWFGTFPGGIIGLVKYMVAGQ